jgi:alginate O-acetyltransferase complex protein AlgI
MLYQSPFYLPFLLMALAVYWLVLRTQAQRTVFLGVASAAFLFVLCISRMSVAASVLQVGGMLALSLAVFRWSALLRTRRSSSALVGGIIGALLPLAAFKYLLPPLSAAFDLAAWAIPLGISYYSFKHIHFMIESWRGNFGDATLAQYAAYICFFPMFAAGPIERFGPFQQQFGQLNWRADDASRGLERIVLGAIKKFLLSDLLLSALLPPATMSGDALAALPWTTVLFACSVKFLLTYCDFSGYTDMALGTARLFGITLMENFNFPLLRSNLAEFWRAWHISLSGFARDYVYFYVLGRWRKPWVALMATMLAIGLWHSGNPGWLLWGVHHGLGLVLLSRFHHAAPRYPRLQSLRRHWGWRLGGTFATLIYVSLGYALTFHPQHFASSVQLYLHIVSLGVF